MKNYFTKYLLLLIFVTLVIVGVFFAVTRFFRIQTITCQSQYGVCNANLELSIRNLQNKDENILKAKSDLITLLKNNKSVLDYSINFKPLFTYSVYVIERKGLVGFALKDKTFALIDKDGIIIDKVNSTSLPKISSSINLDQSELAYVANLMYDLSTFYKVNTGQITVDGLTINNIDGKHVIFPLTGDKDVLLGALSLIISRLPSIKEATTIVAIDLRFKNPVLR